MDFEQLHYEFDQYYTLYLNECVVKVKDDLKIIITRLLNMMAKQWEQECFEEALSK